MEGLRQYAVSVVTVTLICSILISSVSLESTKSLLRITGGVILALAVVAPLLSMEIPALDKIPIPQLQTGKRAVEEGEELAQDEMASIIKEACEAYILDKAIGLGADIRVTVDVDRDHVPVSATLSGSVPAGIKYRLETILETDLGIAKENQLWTG